MIKIPNMENYPKIRLNLKALSFNINSWKMTTLLFFAKFVISAFYLAIVFEFNEY